MASQRPRRNNSPASSKLQPLKATVPIASLIRNPSPTRRGRQSPGSSPAPSQDSKSRVRRSPDVFSTEHRALVSPLGDKPKPMKLNLNIRRTTSLETLSSSYMNGQWPKDGITSSNKGTQTPQVWEEYIEENNLQHQQQKRSSSFGSADTKEKIRHLLQRSKQSQPIHTQSPVQGDHSAVPTQYLVSTHSQSRAIPIPSSPKTPSLHTRRSVEGLNTEIETLVLHADDDDEKVFERTPEGHRAPIASLLIRNVDNHTQTANGIIDQSDLMPSVPSGGTSRCQSDSPSWPVPPGGIGDSRPSSRSSSSGQGTHETESPDTNIQNAKYSSSPKPNNSFLFARGPPDGAERIPLHIDSRDLEEALKKSDTITPKFGPDRTKGNIRFSKNSPFSPLPCQPQVLGGINAGSQT